MTPTMHPGLGTLPRETRPDLVSLSRDIGKLATAIRVHGETPSLDEIWRSVYLLDRADVIATSDFCYFSEKVNNFSENPTREKNRRLVAESLSMIEGGIWRYLYLNNVIPDEDKQRFRNKVLSAGSVTLEDVYEADRWIRLPFLQGFASSDSNQKDREAFVLPTPIEKGSCGTIFQKYRKMECEEQFRHPDFVGSGPSYHLRGALYFLTNACLAGFDLENTVIETTSHGEHAKAVAYAARRLGFKRVRAAIPKGEEADRFELHALGVETRPRFFREDDDNDKLVYLDVPFSRHALLKAGMMTLGLEVLLQIPDSKVIEVPAGHDVLFESLTDFFSKEKQKKVFRVGTSYDAPCNESPIVSLSL